ncbi:hypothetical protein ILUMI_20539 [Ignelater luminosus]|uniref:Uncharacterized protein n=1 Tax=Ignelater luminosus TaxID=2038154 RepID=A0A8K0CG73_IGNLU|nr:hypothetical protein ILUMI_20539 [Ignelater luminosus]
MVNTGILHNDEYNLMTYLVVVAMTLVDIPITGVVVAISLDEALQEDIPYISKDELDDAISEIKMEKAPGEDKITGEIKYLQEEDKQELLSLLNLIAGKKTPKDWRTGMRLWLLEDAQQLFSGGVGVKSNQAKAREECSQAKMRGRTSTDGMYPERTKTTEAPFRPKVVTLHWYSALSGVENAPIGICQYPHRNPIESTWLDPKLSLIVLQMNDCLRFAGSNAVRHQFSCLLADEGLLMVGLSSFKHIWCQIVDIAVTRSILLRIDVELAVAEK